MYLNRVFLSNRNASHAERPERREVDNPGAGELDCGPGKLIPAASRSLDADVFSEFFRVARHDAAERQHS